jgi:SAM-dependent methyltransferase
MSRTPAYNWLAVYYDRIFAAARAPLDAARVHVLGPILPRVESACDLACGTGATALTLARAGIEMVAVDVSPAMCRLAREMARSAGLPVRVLRGDMQNFRLPRPVDLVVCEGDALNHVPNKAGLRLVARAVFRALRPGGYFFFDVNNRAGFKRYWRGNFWTEQPGVVLVMRNGNDYLHDRAWSDIEWFIREGALWRRRRERVDEVCWTPAEIRAALRDAGFGRLRAWDATPFFKGNPMIRPGCRSVYLARNAPNEIRTRASK